MARTRKVRNDRVYLVYQIAAPTGETYVGITARIGQAYGKTLKTRLRRHFSKAFNEDREWMLHEVIREYPLITEWNIQCIAETRGRKSAYALERQYIAEFQPVLNTF